VERRARGAPVGSRRVTDAGIQPTDDAELVARLRAGDERAFEDLVSRNYGTMLAVAQRYVSSRAVAEEVVQEAWLGVLKGIDRFEGRSSLRTWILRILVNTAKTRGAREARSTPYSSLAPDGDEPSVDPDRFRGPDESFPGHWRSHPGEWHALPEDALLGRETLQVVTDAIAELPPAQRAVITMRDLQGYAPDEVSAVLEISDGNQRVLLHRARSRVRAALERYFDG
jgi:RNA polymerase sigma-70 factor, ECF subfamily